MGQAAKMLHPTFFAMQQIASIRLTSHGWVNAYLCQIACSQFVMQTLSFFCGIPSRDTDYFYHKADVAPSDVFLLGSEFKCRRSVCS